jgi:hypothetical protein
MMSRCKDNSNRTRRLSILFCSPWTQQRWPDNHHRLGSSRSSQQCQTGDRPAGPASPSTPRDDGNRPCRGSDQWRHIAAEWIASSRGRIGWHQARCDICRSALPEAYRILRSQNLVGRVERHRSSGRCPAFQKSSTPMREMALVDGWTSADDAQSTAMPVSSVMNPRRFTRSPRRRGRAASAAHPARAPWRS